MASFQDVITGSGNAGKSSLVYMLLLTNVLGLSIFMEKNLNLGLHLKTKQNTVADMHTTQDKEQEQSSQLENLPILIPESVPSDKEITEPVEKAFDESYNIGEYDGSHDDSASEKVIDFKEAVKEIKSKESLKESRENMRESKEPLKTLVWHFPRATSKRYN